MSKPDPRFKSPSGPSVKRTILDVLSGDQNVFGHAIVEGPKPNWLQGLNDTQIAEFRAAGAMIKDAMVDGNATGALATVVTSVSPAVGERILALGDYLSGGAKQVPFGPSLTREEIAAADGMSPAVIGLTDAMDTFDVAAGLQDRMPGKPEVAEPGLRNSIDAAHAAHEIHDIVRGGDPDRPVEIDASGISLRGLIGGAARFHSGE